MESPFVGRRRELDSLVRAVTDAFAGRGPRAVLVVGEAGSGKTRLLTELQRNTTGRILHVAGRQPEGNIPLAASRQLLRALTDVPGDGPRLEELVFAPPAEEQELARLRVLEAAHRCVARLGPTLLLADDVQWTDELTRALLHYLVTAAVAAGQPLGLVLAARPSPVAVALADSLRRELPVDAFARVTLGPLDRDDAVALARSMDPGLGDEEAAALWRATGGSPFWLVQHQPAAGGVSDAAALVSDRLRSLPMDAAGVLAVLAVAGRRLSLDDLAGIRRWPASRVEPAARALIDVGLARTAGTGLELVHDLIREGALRSLAETERRGLHRRLAEHLEDQAGDDIAMLREVLQHRLASDEPALDVALRLVSAPQRRLFGVEGLRELGAVADGAAADDPATIPLHAALAALAVDLGEDEIARHRWRVVAASTPEAAVRGRALAGAARSSVDLGDARGATELISRARRLDIEDPAVAIEVDAATSAVACWADHRLPEAVRAADRAVVAARDVVASRGGLAHAEEALRRAYVSALLARYDAAQVMNDDDRLLPLADELLEASAGLGPLQFTAELRRGTCLRYTGRTLEAVTVLAPLWREAIQRILPASALQAGCELATAHYQLGELAAAETVAAEAEALGRRTGHPRYRSLLRRLLVRLQLHGGDWGAALAVLEQEAGRERSEHLRIGVYEELAAWTARLRGPEGAEAVEAHLSNAWDIDAVVGCRRCGAHLRSQTIEALARVGRTEAAAASSPAGRSDPEPPAGVLSFAHRRALAALAVARGSVEAIPRLEGVIAEADARGWRLDAIWGRLDLAPLVDRGRAVELYESAARAATEAGAVTEERRAEQQLRALGVRTWRRGAAEPGSSGLLALTPREREVAGRVATGASNPEIAAALFLSRKTVERHVSNILTKLGLRNRTELTALMTSGGRDTGMGELPDEGSRPRP